MPTRDTPWPDGTPCWIDYGASDLAAAKSFYGSLLGWDFTPEDAAFGNYTNALRDGRQVAGMGPQMNPADPVGWTTYFATSNIRGHLAAITEAGGAVIVEPMEVGEMGTMALALDPQGAMFGLWQAGTHTGVEVYGEPGALAWTEASVDDPDVARPFYAKVFGYRYTEMAGAEGYTTFATNGEPLGGLGGRTPGLPKGWETCFAVASTDDAVATVQAAGGKLDMGPMDTPFGRFAVLEDPWGAAFEVMGPTSG